MLVLAKRMPTRSTCSGRAPETRSRRLASSSSTLQNCVGVSHKPGAAYHSQAGDGSLDVGIRFRAWGVCVRERCESPLRALVHAACALGALSLRTARFLLRAARSSFWSQRKLLPPSWLPSPAVCRGPPVMHLTTPRTSSSPVQASFLPRGLLTGRCVPVLDSVQGVANGQRWITCLLNESVNKYL